MTGRWLQDFSVFGVDDNTRRKKRRKELLVEADVENPPIRFDEFKPGKSFITLYFYILI